MLASNPCQALTSVTSNFIYGHAPYLTLDGGHTRVMDTDGLLGISLSNGTRLTPTTNNSTQSNPIELPNLSETLANVEMFIPINTNSIELNLLIGAPYFYWGDDDGDGQGSDGVSANGSLSLTIVDNNNQAVARNARLDICNAPYKLTLSTTGGALTTHYGFPKSSNFNASTATYYINPKALPKVCFVKPNLKYGKNNEPDSWAHGVDFRGPISMWNENKGFIPQSSNPSFYYLNFPSTGADHLYFDLEIAGSGPLKWEPVEHNGITATIDANSTGNRVKVTLTGPVASKQQWNSDRPNEIANEIKILRPNLPQTFELVGKDDNGNAIIKYGFKLKQWFVNRGNKEGKYYNYIDTEKWCENINYRLPMVKDLTNASCQGINSGHWCEGANVGAIYPSPNNYYQRRIDAGFFSEWGDMYYYSDASFGFYGRDGYWTSDHHPTDADPYIVHSSHGHIGWGRPDYEGRGLCVVP